MAIPARDPVQASQSEPALHIEAHRRPNGQVRYGVRRSVGFTERVRVGVIRPRLAPGIIPGKDGSRPLSAVGQSAKCAVDQFSNAQGLGDAWRVEATLDDVSGNRRPGGVLAE